MKEHKDIEKLIEQYYNGDTSLEEELQLQTFFEGEDIPDHLKSYQDQFRAVTFIGGVNSELSDDELFAKLEVEVPVIEMKSSKSSVWVYRVAAAVALVLTGVWVGNQIRPDNGLKQMQAQLDEMKTIMFSQLESSSASGRLQAVSSSMAFEEADDETVDVLIATLKNDESMHVRSKAAQALVKFSADDKVKIALRNALLEESEPAVQIALIEGLVSLKEKSSIEVLQQLSENDDVVNEVKEEAHLGIFRLKEL
ncbi:HEAT repeat domain-containing protein [Roseivirga sp.]|uniref:HEAT repeat domain-containing protein n=1 Tax=Roseivirga sp. TaxID=1964215 RepID=UPI003B8B5BD4